jgi:excisionase family DNA binding protein
MSTQQTIGHAAGLERLGEELPGDADLLTADEVAAILRMTKAWVYTQTRADRIPHVSLGRYVRYRRSAVLAWLGEIERGAVAGSRW